MGDALSSRLQFLRQTQNVDGGWGYFPGKKSWLEPTAYATLALHAAGVNGPEADRARACIDSWALPEGGWRAGAEVAEYHWSSALCLTLDCVVGRKSRGFDGGLRRLLLSNGSESSAFYRALGGGAAAMNRELLGWAYRDGSTAWVEPTALALVALKKIERQFGGGLGLAKRVSLGERMLLDRRCADGGWNYGNRQVLGVVLPSYPEVTAIALVGLQGVSTDLTGAIALLEQAIPETRSPLTYAWTRVALQGHRRRVPPGAVPVRGSRDILVAALECLAQAPHQVLAMEQG